MTITVLIARNISILIIIFQLISCASDESSGTEIVGSSDEKLDDSLFVLDSRNGVVASFSSELPTTSTDFTENILSSEKMFGTGIAYDISRDDLYVTADSSMPNMIEVFNKASQRVGKINATRTIILEYPGIFGIQDILLDLDRDTLYVLAERIGDGVIIVLNSVSELNGTILPDRVILSVNRGSFAIDFNRSILYSTNDSIISGTIQAYSNIDTINGRLPFDVRLISQQGISNISAIAIDSINDILYAVEEKRGVRVIEGASTAGYYFGVITDSKYVIAPLIDLSGAPIYNSQLKYDSINDRLYVGFIRIVYAINQISTIASPPSASKNIFQTTAPSGTRVSGFAFP